MERSESAGMQPLPAAAPRAATHAAASASALEMPHVEAVRGLDALTALRPEWRALWASDPRATPFQAPAWLVPWAQQFAPDRTQALAVRDARGLRALLPYFTWRNTLLLAGTGPSDYGDGLFTADACELGAWLMAELCAAAVALRCAEVDLQQLRPDSLLLAAALPAGWSEQRAAGTPCPVAPLTGEQGLDAVSPHWRKNARHAQRQLERQFRVDFDAGAGACDAAELERLHGLRWSSAGEAHAFADPAMRAFLRAVVPALAADGLLRFTRVLLDGKTAAVVFAMRAGDACHFYLSGFDPQWSRYSTGLLSVLHAMRSAAREGATQFHFLRGGEAYKYHLGASDRATFRRVLRHVGNSGNA